MAGFKCPFCGWFMTLSPDNYSSYCFNFESYLSPDTTQPCLEVAFFRCPNYDCQKETVISLGINGYLNDVLIPIFPRSRYVHFPDYVPAAIRQDYEEAHTIMQNSPKAAATLARRCLQGMIHDFWGIHEKNLNAEITQLKGKIPASQWKAIDAVRSIGNIGAHMEHDVSRIIDVDPDEANKLVRLIEHLIEKWYIDHHDAEVLYTELADISQEKADARKG